MIFVKCVASFSDGGARRVLIKRQTFKLHFLTSDRIIRLAARTVELRVAGMEPCYPLLLAVYARFADCWEHFFLAPSQVYLKPCRLCDRDQRLNNFPISLFIGSPDLAVFGLNWAIK